MFREFRAGRGSPGTESVQRIPGTLGTGPWAVNAGATSAGLVSAAARAAGMVAACGTSQCSRARRSWAG